MKDNMIDFDEVIQTTGDVFAWVAEQANDVLEFIEEKIT